MTYRRSFSEGDIATSGKIRNIHPHSRTLKDEQDLETTNRGRPRHAYSMINEDVNTPFSQHVLVICKTDRITQYHEKASVVPPPVDQKPTADKQEISELLSDQTTMQEIEDLQDKMRPLLSLIHSLHAAAESSSRFMLDELRRGVYDSALLDSERSRDPRMCVCTFYPWHGATCIACYSEDRTRETTLA